MSKKIFSMKLTSDNMVALKERKTWGFSPVTRVVQDKRRKLAKRQELRE